MNNNSILFLLLLLIMSPAFSQSSETVYLWPDKISNENEISEKSVQANTNSGIITKILEIEHPSFTVYKPQGNGNGVGVIICPGGGFSILAIDLEGVEIAQWLTKLGYTAFVLKYSVPNKEIEALNELKKAVSIIRNKSEKFNVSKDKLGVLGFSAGGSLCARISTMSNEDVYLIGNDKELISCRPDFTLLIYPAYLDKGKNNTISPELNIKETTSPMFIFGTSDDVYGNSALVMSKALKSAGASVELNFLEEGGHGYGLRKGNIAAETWPKLAEIWLKKISKY